MKLLITNELGKAYKYSGFTEEELRKIMINHVKSHGHTIMEIEYIDDSKWPHETRLIVSNR